ncbi:TRIO and F-actin-binding protein-like [Oenanthe melanoleuca]|uniref:TRIO and F-actin-binding protein-like n=1 Tax=Oenanthe melanoleuca TaxID=2939378 RepID=UPI0024C118FE|nr:TRIO and F-actin-binding protein-like [Oenanthe melanoleuca]
MGPASLCPSSRDWHESRRYPPLSPGAEGEHRETGTDPSACAEANSTLAREGEMTRLWDNTLGSGKRDMMSYLGHKEEVQSRAPQADRPSSPPKTCFAVDVVASRVARASPSNGLLPVPERRPASQKPEESWPKHRKTDPPWPSTLPARSDLLAGARAREPRGRSGTAGAEGRHGLERQQYSVLADLPKPKRLGQRDAAERYGSRTLSPGRVEVERMFGCERRKSETLEAFQALEEGRVDRLDGKTPVPPSKGHLTRRRSSPNLPREGQRLSWQLEQRSRDPKERRRSPSPAQRPEKAGRTRGDSPRPASPAWLLERGSPSPRSASPARRTERRAEEPLNPPCRAERSWRSRGEPTRSPNSDRGRATWQAGGTRQALEKKSQGDSLRSTGAGKGSDNVRLSRAGPPPWALSAGRCTESTRKSQKDISPPSLVRGAERQRAKAGEPLHPAGPRKASEGSWQSLREKLASSQPGKGTSSDCKGRGKPLRPTSPTRALEQDWRGRGDAHQAQAWDKDWKRQETPVCHADVMRQLERDWKSPARCLDAGLRSDDSWIRPESPAQHLEEDWRGRERTRDAHSPEKPLETDWGNKSLLIYHPQLGGGTFPLQSSTGSSGSPQPHLNASKKHNKVGARPWEL